MEPLVLPEPSPIYFLFFNCPEQDGLNRNVSFRGVQVEHQQGLFPKR